MGDYIDNAFRQYHDRICELESELTALKAENEKLRSLNEELLEECEDALVDICSLCKRLNPGHDDCGYCEGTDRLRVRITKAKEGK